MSFCKLFPRLFSVCFVLSMLALSARAAQTPARTRLTVQAPQTTTTTQTDGRTRLENGLAVAPQDGAEKDAAGESAGGAEGYVVPSSKGRVGSVVPTAIC